MLDVPIFYLVHPDNSPHISSSRARAFLISSNSVLDLGTPRRDRIEGASELTK